MQSNIMGFKQVCLPACSRRPVLLPLRSWPACPGGLGPPAGCLLSLGCPLSSLGTGQGTSTPTLVRPGGSEEEEGEEGAIGSLFSCHADPGSEMAQWSFPLAPDLWGAGVEGPCQGGQTLGAQGTLSSALCLPWAAAWPVAHTNPWEYTLPRGHTHTQGHKLTRGHAHGNGAGAGHSLTKRGRCSDSRPASTAKPESTQPCLKRNLHSWMGRQGSGGGCLEREGDGPVLPLRQAGSCCPRAWQHHGPDVPP